MNNFIGTILVSILCSLLSGCGSEPQPLKEQSVKVITGKVTTEPQKRAITYLGRTRAESSSSLSFEISGLVSEVLVDIGDTVEQGELLAKLDTQVTLLQLKQTQADVQRAEFEVQNTRAELERRKKLIDRDLISLSEVEQWELQLTGAQAQLEVAKAARDLAQKKVNDTHLRAPYNGIISSRHVQAKQNVMQGQPIVDLVKADDTVEVTVFIPEKYAVPSLLQSNAFIHNGRQDALSGLVKDISGQANRFGLVEVLLTVKNTTTATIKPGIPVDVEFSLSAKPNGIQVPVSSVISGQNDNKFVIWRLSSESRTVSAVPVSVLSVHDETALVSGNLAHGDSIVTHGGTRLREGQLVSVISP